MSLYVSFDLRVRDTRIKLIDRSRSILNTRASQRSAFRAMLRKRRATVGAVRTMVAHSRRGKKKNKTAEQSRTRGELHYRINISRVRVATIDEKHAKRITRARANMEPGCGRPLRFAQRRMH